MENETRQNKLRFEKLEKKLDGLKGEFIQHRHTGLDSPIIDPINYKAYVDKDKLIAEYHGTTTVTMTNANQLYNLQSVLIPANTFITGDSVYIRSICGKNTSGATSRRMVLNFATTITTAGNQIAQFTSASSGARYILAVERITDIVATGLRTFEPTVSALTDISNTGSGTGTNVYPTVAIDWTVDQYLNVCGLSISAATDMEIYHIEVWRYRI